MTTFPVLTLRQPWASLVAAGVKPVENRVWGVSHRGPLAIHAGVGWDREALWHQHVWFGLRAILDYPTGDDLPAMARARLPRGAVLAVVDLTGIHMETGRCCAPWGVSASAHWELANVRPLVSPVAATGRQGLWRLSADVDAAVRGQLERVDA